MFSGRSCTLVDDTTFNVLLVSARWLGSELGAAPEGIAPTIYDLEDAQAAPRTDAVAFQQTRQLSLQKRHEVNTRLAARDGYDGRSGEQGLATGSERTSR